jgi:2-dehydro-3-deoxyphosphogluconate aldolase/(4S)-4-hydroxy-2-oxoglutarate aldolase
VPTGGIRADDLADYLRLPTVLAVGGTWLAPRAVIDAGDFETIARETRAATSLVEQLR